MNNNNTRTERQDKNIDIQNIKIEADDEIIFVFLKSYKLFLAMGKSGLDALLLYCHLQFTARLQQTNSVLAKNIYLARGLHWNEKRIKKAKAFLHKHGFIQYKQERDKNNQFGQSYIVVRTTRIPQGLISAPADSGTCGSSQQMLKLTNKCFNEKVNTLTNNALTVNVLNGGSQKDAHHRVFDSLVFNLSNVQKACDELSQQDFTEYQKYYFSKFHIVAKYYFENYQIHICDDHPPIKAEYWPGIITRIVNNTDLESILEIIDAYFADPNLQCDHNIIHFSQENIIAMRNLELM